MNKPALYEEIDRLRHALAITRDALIHADLRLCHIPHSYDETDFRAIREALQLAHNTLETHDDKTPMPRLP